MQSKEVWGGACLFIQKHSLLNLTSCLEKNLNDDFL